MPEVRPNADELLEIVAEFISHISKNELSGQAAFHARVAANAVTMARRELDHKAGMDAGEVARLATNLRHDSSQSELTHELAARWLAGDSDLDRAATLRHLRQVVRDKLLLSNPKYISAADAADVADGRVT
jgi:hypothetical protein